MKRGLLITFYFPPLNSVASHRLYSFAKYLNNKTGSLDVFCPDIEGDLNYSLEGIKVIRMPKQKFDLNYGKTKLSFLGKLKNFILNRVFKRNYFVSSRKNQFYIDATGVLKKMNLNEYDYVITSYGPLDALHIGNWIKQNYPEIKWIADYRDLYSLMDYYSFGWSAPFFRMKEKRILKNADYFITVSEVLLRKQAVLLNKKGDVIYNGYEPYSPVINNDFSGKLTSMHLPIISYTGSLYGGERDLLPFLHYFVKAKLDDKYALVFAMINDEDEEYFMRCVKKSGVKNYYILRNLSYDNTLVLQKHSVALLLLANFGNRANGYLTGKVFEYIGARKPIIYSGNDSDDYELYQLIRNNNLGDSFSLFDYNNFDKYSLEDKSKFSRKYQAKKLEEIINRLIQR